MARREFCVIWPEADESLKFTTNRQKLAESNLTVSSQIFRAAETYGDVLAHNELLVDLRENNGVKGIEVWDNGDIIVHYSNPGICKRHKLSFG